MNKPKCKHCGNSLTKGRIEQGKKSCFPCEREIRKIAAARQHERRIMATYGLREGEYSLLYFGQGGKCAICRVATGRARRLAVDHDHAVAEMRGMRASVRGLLCSGCNRMLGRFRDDSDALMRAAEYLRDWPAKRILNETEHH